MMKVKPNIKNIGLITEQYYYVYEFRICNNDEMVIVIENEDKQIGIYDLSLFEIIDDTEPNEWIEVVRGNYKKVKTYPEFKEVNYWEKLFNDDIECIKVFYQVKSGIYGTLDYSDCKIKIHSKSIEEQSFVIDSIAKYKREEFIDDVIQLARQKLKLNTIKFKVVLVSAFSYLAKFRSNRVESFFLEYYENIEFGTQELTSIVDSYFMWD